MLRRQLTVNTPIDRELFGNDESYNYKTKQSSKYVCTILNRTEIRPAYIVSIELICPLLSETLLRLSGILTFRALRSMNKMLVPHSGLHSRNQ